ncbi:MAG: hypothetical protein OXU77_12930 [Gammaproteobacteria bacterium]|nr:hypothetical protein [Gammaproteobacteria bacterium]MDE0444601.1 hypothetical protein [Gammaproteobacteria bacterium]
MGFWTFLGLAVICGCLLGGYSIHARSKSRTSKADVLRLEARLAGLESSGNLEERVRALEAIVTDPKFQLDREISKLEKSPGASASDPSD